MIPYAAIAKNIDSILKSVGFTASIYRAGVKIGSGYAVFTGGDAKNESSSPSSVLAQTSIGSNEIVLSGLAKEPQVGDTIVAVKETYTIQEVNTVQPSTTNLVFKLKVTL